jgi:hypothetical protein
MVAALAKAMNVLAISLKSTFSLETGKGLIPRYGLDDSDETGVSRLSSMTSIFYVDGETGWLLA